MKFVLPCSAFMIFQHAMIFFLKRLCIVSLLVSFVFLTGCPPQRPVKKEKKKSPVEVAKADEAKGQAPQPAEKAPPQPAPKPDPKQQAKPAPKPAEQTAPKPVPKPAQPAPKPVPPMTAEEEAVKALVERLGEARNTFKPSDARAINELSINTDVLNVEDVQLIAKLKGLEKLSFSDCRDFTDEYTKELLPLADSLTFLKIGNSRITKDSAETLSEFSKLTELNIEKNAGIKDAACQFIAKMEKLERLNMIYTGLTETGLMTLRKLPNLQALDIRGCTMIADSGMKNVARIKTLKSFQHYSSSVSDAGLEALTAAENIESLYLQDFRLTDAAGQSLKKFSRLTSLQLFRCSEFGSQGLLELKGMPLTRLTLRGLSSLGNDGFEVFRELPTLKRLYLTELQAVSDAAFLPLAELKNLEILEVEIIPGVTDEALKSIAKLQNLRELKLRSVGITDAGLDEILKLPKLTSLQLLDLAGIDDAAAKEKFAKKNYKTLTIGKTKGELQE